MGNEICSCLNDLTSNESNDLSRELNDTEESKNQKMSNENKQDIKSGTSEINLKVKDQVKFNN